jgi:hypothetical protein
MTIYQWFDIKTIGAVSPCLISKLVASSFLV